MEYQLDPKESEARLISSVIEQDCLHRLLIEGIKSDDLLIWGDVLKFVVDHYNRHNTCPSVETICIAFPEFPTFPTDNCDLDFLIDVTNENRKKKRLREILSRTVDSIESGSASEAASFLLSQVPEIERQTRTRATFIDSDPDAMLQRYLSRKDIVESGRKLGVSSGINALDKELMCYMPGDFVLLVGPPEVGKSFVLLKGCATAYSVNKRVMFISPEMVEEDITARFHPIIGREWGYHLSNEAIMSGHGVDVKEYESFLRRLGKRQDFLVIDDIEGGEITVAKIEGLMKEYSPEFVAIDTLMLMTSSDGSRAIDWGSLLEVAYGLKFLAVRTKTIIMATAGTTADTFSSTTPATLSDLGLSKNVAFALDVGISMSMSNREKTRNLRVMKRRKGKGISGVLPMQFDPDSGRIG